MSTAPNNPTSRVNHAGDSTPQSTKHDAGVGSGVWLGHPVSFPMVVESGPYDEYKGTVWSVEFGHNVPESHCFVCRDEDEAWRLWNLIRAIPSIRERA